MQYIDLHVHSSHSDGTLPPAALMERAAGRGLAAVALTDHDTVLGIGEALNAAAALPLRLIPGVELSVSYKERDIHLLGLCVDHQDPGFVHALHLAAEERKRRNQKMAAKLAAAGIPITLEALYAEQKDAVITRAHFAKYLCGQGYAKNVQDAFQRYLGEDGPYYVPRRYMTPEEGISLILRAKGIPVLAHPLIYRLVPEDLDQLVCRLKGCGLAALEALYSSNTGSDESDMRQLAKRYDLLLSGGSDFHGSNKPLIELGKGKGSLKVPMELLTALEEWKARNI